MQAELTTHLPDSVQSAVADLLNALAAALGKNLVGVSLYGSAARGDYAEGISDVNLLVIVERLESDVMRRVLDPVTRGRGRRIAPFFIEECELAGAAAAFPGKFLTIREEHKPLAGRDVLTVLEIDRGQIRLRCQQEACNLLFLLRRRFMMQQGHRLIELLTAEIGGFLDTLRTALTLTGEGFHSREDAIEPAAKHFGFDAKVLRDIVALRTATEADSRQVDALYDRLLDIVALVLAKL